MFAGLEARDRLLQDVSSGMGFPECNMNTADLGPADQ